MLIHIRTNERATACCGSRSRNYISSDGADLNGTTPWPWAATDSQIISHLCPRCREAKGEQLIESLTIAGEQRSAEWNAIPEPIRRAIETARGGNNTVIRCDVPGYSSRLSNCVDRLCREMGWSKRRLGSALLNCGMNHICGHPIPQRWAATPE